jgi:hypothetical protein
MSDKINHPQHYTSGEAKCTCGRIVECIDIVRTLGFNAGNIIKYVWRYKDKNGLEDLKKAQWYLNDLVRKEENKTSD